jgi:hypothetical protein
MTPEECGEIMDRKIFSLFKKYNLHLIVSWITFISGVYPGGACPPYLQKISLKFAVKLFKLEK